MAGDDGARLHGLVDDRTVYAAMDAIEQAFERTLTADTETQRRREASQLRGLLVSLPRSGLSLEGGLRRLIMLLRVPIGTG